MTTSSSRQGLTLIELLMVLAILSILTGLSLAAVQKARMAAARAACANNLHQIGLALQMYYDSRNSFPPGMEWNGSNNDVFFGQSWHVYLLPDIEQAALAAELDESKYLFPQSGDSFDIPNNLGLTTVLPVYCCLADPATGQTVRALNPLSGPLVSATTSYLGVEGTNLYRKNGVLFCRSRVRLNEITDGASQTLLVGERPAYPSALWGIWWSGLFGQLNTGSGATVLGVRERMSAITYGPNWPDGQPYLGFSGEAHFVQGDSINPYHAWHFWSWHGGGANFLFVDGSVRFLPYAADAVLPALATRAGGEAVSLDW